MAITNNILINKLKKFRTIYQSSDPSITPETITWVWQQSTTALAENHSANTTNLQFAQTAVSSLISSTINATAFPSSTSSSTVSKASDPIDTATNSALNTANFQSAMHDDAEPATTDTEALYRVLAIVEGRIAYNRTIVSYLINPNHPKADKAVYLATVFEQDSSAFTSSFINIDVHVRQFITGCAQDANHYCMLRDFILSHLQTENKHFLDQLYFTIESSLQSNYEDIERQKKLANASVKHTSLRTIVATNDSKAKKFSTKVRKHSSPSREIEDTFHNSRNFEAVHYREILTLLKPFLSEDNNEFSALINEIQKKEGINFSVNSCQEKLGRLIQKVYNSGRELQNTIKESKFQAEFILTINESAQILRTALEKLFYNVTIDEASTNNQSLTATNALLSLREAHSNLKKAKKLIAECRANFKKKLLDDIQFSTSTPETTVSGSSNGIESAMRQHAADVTTTGGATTNSAATATQPNRPPSLSSPSTSEGKVKTENEMATALQSTANLAENTAASASPSASKLSDKEALADYYFNNCSPNSASPTRISPLRTTAAGSPTTATATATYSIAAATAAAGSASANEPATASQPGIANSSAAGEAFTPAASAHLKQSQPKDEAQLKGKTDTAVNTNKLSKEESEQLNFLFHRLTSTQQETLANLLREDYNDKSNNILLANIRSLIEGAKADGGKAGGLLGRVIETKGGSSHYGCQLPNTYQNWTIVKIRNVYGYFDIPTTKGPGLHAKDKQHIPIAAIEHARETLTRAGITKERLEMAGIKLNTAQPACKK